MYFIDCSLEILENKIGEQLFCYQDPLLSVGARAHVRVLIDEKVVRGMNAHCRLRNHL